MRATVDRSRCQGHALCVLDVPDLFALDDEDSRAYVLLDSVPDTLVELARSAVGSCPERAISLTG
jgi:ferredoxin